MMTEAKQIARLTAFAAGAVTVLAASGAAQDDYYGASPRRGAKARQAREHTQPRVEPLPAPPRPGPLQPAPGGISDAGPVPIAPSDNGSMGSMGSMGTMALVGGTVHTATGEQRVTVLVEDGRISALGGNVPDGVRRIDVTGLHVYPSLIAADTVLGLVEINAVRSTRDYSEVGDINPNVSAEVSVNPSSELIPVTRSNGFLIAMTAPRGGLISGTAAIIELDGWTTEDMTLKAPAALLVEWPRMRLNHSPRARKPIKKQEKARDEKIEKLRETFETARAYANGMDAVASGKAKPKEHDVKWDAMIAAVRGELPVLISASSVLQIKAAIEFAEAQGLDLILRSGTDVLKVLDQLAEKDIPVMLTSVMRVGRSHEPYDVNFTLPIKLHEAGVRFCIVSGSNGFSAAHIRSLPYVAAKSVAYGLPREVALASLTSAPAEILGISDRLGSIDEGKDATLIITDGDPLDIRSNVHRAFIRGRELDLTDRHKRLYERYRKRPAREAAGSLR